MSAKPPSKLRETVVQLAVRFVGDSGDGMQLIGSQFTTASALMGNDLATMPDYPAEIRAPAGTLAGVSGFQIQFSSAEIYTPGDIIQALVAMNAAALKVNLGDLDTNGIIIANSDSFTEANLKMAGYSSNPLEDGSLSHYRTFSLPITKMTREAVAPAGVRGRDADRCKNMYALGIVYWLFDRDMTPTLRWLEDKFGRKPDVLQANTLALKAGYYFGETAEMFQTQYEVERAKQAPGLYRKIRGAEALAMGLIAAANTSGKQLYYASYPITPASDILEELAQHKEFGVKTFQAEDEISAMCSVIGASFGGALAATGTSGPGLALKTEAIGLAVMLELPCVIIDAQRGGPSTGLPTKTEQSDLLQALFGRSGECPLPIIAPQSPSDCFFAAIEAFRIAVRYMTPVILLSDGYLQNGAEPWKVPSVEDLPRLEIQYATDPEGFEPYARNADLARPWALPGTPGMAHRIGGLEKQDVTGNVSYDPVNHERMCHLRAEKVAKVADSLPGLSVLGDEAGELLVISWGSAYGAVRTAVERARKRGLSVSHLNLRHLNPLPKDLGSIIANFKKTLVAELNLGQLRMLIRSRYLVNAEGLNKIQGRPFTVTEILSRIEKILSED